ncbi:rhodanese-like domain-containing protein [Halopelagius fulvigenes]|uniref:Rhodanese-like domain-containing protein n=1 Tax=Halopelagius fulvigenes TaxID=1198324 RepID=A0ABD5TTV5_9EURY
MDGEIDPAEVETLLDDEDPPRVVDIRSPGKFSRGHIPGSLNIPFGELPTRVAEIGDADRIVTVCPHGQASVQAARLIKSYEGTADARVESMAGGLTEWDGPLETRSETADPGANADEGPEAPF